MRNEVIDVPKCLQNSEPPERFGTLDCEDSPLDLTPPRLRSAFFESLKMLRPAIQKKNPAIFLIEITAVLTLTCIVLSAIFRTHTDAPLPFLIFCDALLFLTVISANFSTALNTARLARRDCAFQPPSGP